MTTLTNSPARVNVVSFTVKAFKAAFDLACKVAPTKSYKQILNMVRLNCADKLATLEATNLERGIRIPFACHAGAEFSVLLSPSKVKAFLKALPKSAGEVVIRTDGDSVAMISGAFRVEMGQSEDSTLFPKIPSWDSDTPCWSFPSESFVMAYDRTHYATDDESTRYALGCVQIEPNGDGTGRAVATDGRRLVVRQMEVERIGKGDLAGEIKLPVGDMRLIRDIANKGKQPVQIQTTMGQHPDNAKVTIPLSAISRIGEIEVYSRLATGRFPRYEDCVPNEHDLSVELDAGLMLEVSQQAHAVATDEAKGFDILLRPESSEFSGAVLIEAGLNRAYSRTLDLPVNGEGPRIITLDSSYVVDAIKSLGKNPSPVRINILDHKNPIVCLADDGRTKIVLMPLTRDRDGAPGVVKDHLGKDGREMLARLNGVPVESIALPDATPKIIGEPDVYPNKMGCDVPTTYGKARVWDCYSVLRVVAPIGTTEERVGTVEVGTDPIEAIKLCLDHGQTREIGAYHDDALFVPLQSSPVVFPPAETSFEPIEVPEHIEHPEPTTELAPIEATPEPIGLPEASEPAESRCHEGFFGTHEYFRIGEAVFHAPIADPIMTGGQRCGRFECYNELWPMRAKMLAEIFPVSGGSPEATLGADTPAVDFLDQEPANGPLDTNRRTGDLDRGHPSDNGFPDLATVRPEEMTTLPEELDPYQADDEPQAEPTDADSLIRRWSGMIEDCVWIGRALGQNEDDPFYHACKGAWDSMDDAQRFSVAALLDEMREPCYRNMMHLSTFSRLVSFVELCSVGSVVAFPLPPLPDDDRERMRQILESTLTPSSGFPQVASVAKASVAGKASGCLANWRSTVETTDLPSNATDLVEGHSRPFCAVSTFLEFDQCSQSAREFVTSPKTPIPTPEPRESSPKSSTRPTECPSSTKSNPSNLGDDRSISPNGQCGESSRRTSDDFIEITIGSTSYAVTILADGFDLAKADGICHRVTTEPDGSLSCDCPDWRFRRKGLDAGGCRHIKGLRANGLVPDWTDAALGRLNPKEPQGGLPDFSQGDDMLDARRQLEAMGVPMISGGAPEDDPREYWVTDPDHVSAPAPWWWENHPTTGKTIALSAKGGDVLLATGDEESSWLVSSKANMALIQAAPDLLAACESLVWSWEEIGSPMLVSDRGKAIQAAIAKAKDVS